MELDSGKQPRRFGDDHIKRVNMSVFLFVLLKAYDVGKTEDNTATKFFRLYNILFTLCEQVGTNTFIEADEQRNKIIGTFHAASLRKYYRH